MGRTAFVERHRLRSDRDKDCAAQVLSEIRQHKLETVRLSFADQHGILRGKTVPAGDFAALLNSGCSMTSSLLLKDTSHRTVFPVWSAAAAFGLAQLQGAGDFIMVPDPGTFRILPWSAHTGWVLCDIYFPSGEAVPFATRALCQNALRTLADRGYDYITGLEIEFHVLKLIDPKLKPEQAGHPGEAPATELLAHGYQYLTELREDELEPVLDLIRRCAQQLQLPVRSVEVEFGPSQVEFTFHPAAGIAHADNMVLFRSAVKQLCRRHGYHATFMCRPALPNVFASGWHLHQSLYDKKTAINAFMPAQQGELLTPLGRQFVAGLLRNAAASCVFTTPTINGYKRYRPYTLAPDHIVWGRDNKGAMIRAISAPDEPASRIENRIGEPAANPYLYFASQIYAGLDGINAKLEPPEPSDSPYDDSGAARLPANLFEALAALKENQCFSDTLGQTFIDYIVAIKQAELARFFSEVTDWEQKEYFSIF